MSEFITNEEAAANDPISEIKMTKAERKLRRREEKQHSRARGAARQKVKRMVAVGAVMVGVVVVGWLMVSINQNPVIEVGESVEGGQIRDDDWVKGNREAKVVLVEYADFQCPACTSFSAVLKQLNNEYGDRVAIVYRHFPLKQIHKNAEPSAYAAEAAGNQGKFWEMHDILYERQSDWSESNDVMDVFTMYARELNLDIERWQADVNSKETKEKVAAAYTEAIRLGLNATPSFVLNGNQVTARSYEQFEEFLQRELGATD